MLIQRLLSKEMYQYKCPYSMTPIGIVVHNTDNDASAKNEIINMTKPENKSSVSFHVAVDDKEAIQGIPFNRNAWSCGDGRNGKGNRKYISVEICYSKSGGTRFIEAEKRASKEIALILHERGWGIERVKRHYDFSGKQCPKRTMAMGWQRFLDMVKAELDKLNKPTTSTKELYRVRKTWKDVNSQKGAYSVLDNAIEECNKHTGYFVFNSNGDAVYPKTDTTFKVKIDTDVLNVRSGAGTNYTRVTQVKKGDVYTIVDVKSNWGKLKSGVGWICLDYTKRL